MNRRDAIRTILASPLAWFWKTAAMTPQQKTDQALAFQIARAYAIEQIAAVYGIPAKLLTIHEPSILESGT